MKALYDFFLLRIGRCPTYPYHSSITVLEFHLIDQVACERACRSGLTINSSLSLSDSLIANLLEKVFYILILALSRTLPSTTLLTDMLTLLSLISSPLTWYKNSKISGKESLNTLSASSPGDLLTTLHKLSPTFINTNVVFFVNLEPDPSQNFRVSFVKEQLKPSDSKSWKRQLCDSGNTGESTGSLQLGITSEQLRYTKYIKKNIFPLPHSVIL
ncbi:hypothetical protein CLU79DRAFT_835227 [Phycomyces nitens]|nr:hypothetical protein CLU79DRAFT_835227 [Phycomyces nitens]